MCVNCNSSACGGCEEVVRSSDILFDGSFTNVQFNPDSTLNEILQEMENYFNSIVFTAADPVFVMANENCLHIPTGEYSYSQMLNLLMTKVCEFIDSTEDFIENFDTDGVGIATGINYGCLTSEIGSVDDLTKVLNFIFAKLCELINRMPATNYTDALPDGTDGWIVDPIIKPNVVVPNKQVSSLLKMADNKKYAVFETPIYSPSSLNITAKPVIGVFNGFVANRMENGIITLPTSKKVFVSLVSDGSLDVVQRDFIDPDPLDNKPDSMHLFKVTTDATGVTSYTPIAKTKPYDDPSFTLADGSVTTSKLADGAVTGVKMEDVVTGSTKGHQSILQVTYDDKGRVTGAVSNIDLAGIADGDVLVYSASGNKFVAGQRRDVPEVGYIPVSDGTDYIKSSFKESATHIQAKKPIEINAGFMQNNSDAGLNVVDGYFLCPRQNVATMALLTPEDGAIVYVTNTDATFTSVGFWGYENGTWKKLS